jgi:hypothetical protein
VARLWGHGLQLAARLGLPSDSTRRAAVAASPVKIGTIAAFTRESVHVSRDDGRTFALLDATADPILDFVRDVRVDAADYGLCAVSVDGSRHAIVTKSTSEWPFNPGSPTVGHNEAVSFALYGDLLVRLGGTSGRIVTTRVPDGQALAVDPCERVVVVANRRIVRWSQQHGWRILR